MHLFSNILQGNSVYNKSSAGYIEAIKLNLSKWREINIEGLKQKSNKKLKKCTYSI